MAIKITLAGKTNNSPPKKINQMIPWITKICSICMKKLITFLKRRKS